MKGIVLAGGLGTRLHPLTKVTNKHLLPIYNKPMIYYPIELMVDAGIRDILIVTGGKNAGDFLRLLGNGRQFGLNHINYTYQEGEGGIAAALSLAEFFADRNPICVILGDNIVEGSIAPFVENFRQQKSGARILLKEVSDPQRFGVPMIDRNRIIRIDEKPAKPASNFAVTGIYMYDAKVFEIIKTLEPSGRGELEITDVNNSYINQGEMQYDIMDGWWTDAGTFESLLRASNLVCQNESQKTGRKLTLSRKNMKLLVTGGAGFIGSNFVRYILSRYSDCTILNLDKLTYAGNLENLSGLESDSRHEFVQGDICDEAAVRRILEKGVDAVVNFAAESHVDRSILNASEFVQTNVVGTLNLLELCRKNGTPRFVQISTDEVYGSLGASGFFTENSPIAPNSPYAASKASADLLVRSYCRTHGFPGIITRCSNNYGPYQFPEKLIPLLIGNAMAGIPLPIYGDGLYVRDWIHVRDHCAAIDAALHHGTNGEIYNVGARQEVPNLDIAHRILKAFGKDSSMIAHVEDRPGHDRRYAIDSSKIETELNWHPTTSFDAGLQETIEWYRRNTQWTDHVRSGAYLTYYDRMYKHRRQTLSER